MMTEIRIKRALGDTWQTVELLEHGGGWYQVDDGNGPLWVALEHIHPDDLAAITADTRTAAPDPGPAFTVGEAGEVFFEGETLKFGDLGEFPRNAPARVFGGGCGTIKELLCKMIAV